MASYSCTNNINIITLTEDDVPGSKLQRSPEESSVMELQRWLECRGEKEKGLKADLTTRVCGLMKINKKKSIPKLMGKWYEMKCMKQPSLDAILTQDSLSIIQDSLSIITEVQNVPTISMRHRQIQEICTLHNCLLSKRPRARCDCNISKIQRTEL